MKKLHLFKSMLLLCALIVGSLSSWADEASYTAISSDKPTAKNGTTNGNVTGTGSVSWSYSVTQETKSTKSPYVQYSDSYGWQLGSGNSPCTAFSISTSGISGTITQIQVVTGSASASSSISVTIGGEAFGTQGQATGSGSTVATQTFTGSASGDIVVTASASSGAFYFKSITVTYTPASSSPLDYITLSGTYPTEFYQGDEFSHAGMTVTAHYEDSSTSDVTGSATFTGYNMNTLGDQTVTVSYTKGVVTKTANYNITILPAPTAVVTLDFTTNDWGISESPTKTVDATEFTSGGYAITLEGSSGNGYYFDTDNIMLGKSGAKLTLPAFGFNVSKIKVYGVSSGASASVSFNVFVGDDPVSTSATSSQVDHEFAIAAGKQNVGTIYVIKVTNANNMRISKIEVFGNGCEAGAVQSYGWATYITTSNVEYPANTAFVVTDASVSTGLTVEEVTQVPTGTPLLLKGEGAKTAIELDAAPAAPATNLLSVSDGSALGSGKYAYVLAKNGEGACFKQWTGTMDVLDGRVILVLDEAIASARELFDLGNETTGIAEVRGMKENVRGEYFNLAGQRVARPTKGLYIVNGKKVIIK